jgi:hypothetical protein
VFVYDIKVGEGKGVSMFSGFTSGEYQSVVFFVDGHVDREMMYSEFDAVLDSFVPMPSYAGKTVQAVCMGINGQIKIVSAIFFLLSFDAVGNADRKWNVPLQQLIEQAESGPDLGAGPIRLCCRSQCPVDWHVQDLWDPDMSRQPNDFVILRDMVARNRHGFKELAMDVDDISQTRQVGRHVGAASYAAQTSATGTSGGFILSSETEMSDADKALAHSLITFIRKKVVLDNHEQLEQLERNQQLLLAAQKTRMDDEVNQLALHHSNEMREMQGRYVQLQETLEQEKQAEETLRRQLQEQQQIMDKLRESFHEQLAQTKSGDAGEMELLKANYTSELEMRIQTVANEYQQMLDAKDVEIAYRLEQQNVLKEEVGRLNEEHAQLIKEAGEQFTNRLKDNGVTFMAYHLGAGNITISLDDIGTYLQNPMAYAANICKISEDDYRDWIAHYNAPVCCAHSEAKGEVCGKKLRRVEIPAQFVAGRSNRCPFHWEFVAEKTEAAPPASGSV